MYRMRELRLEVEMYREYLQKLVEDKKVYTDAEVLSVSRMLDILINEYCNLLKDKDEKNNPWYSASQTPVI